MIASALLTTVLMAASAGAAAELDEEGTDTSASPVEHETTIARGDACAATAETEAQPAQPASTPPPSTALAGQPAPAPAPAETPPQKPRPDILGISVVGVGAALGIAGLGVYGSARGKLKDPPLGGTEGEHVGRQGELARRAKVGIGLAAAGGVIAVVGVIHIVLHARKRKSASPSPAAPVRASVGSGGFVLRF